MFPQIPLASASDYVGAFFLIFGFYLILSGFGILKIEKITIPPGSKTWGFGILIALVGAYLLFYEPGKAPPNPDVPTETPPAPSLPTDTQNTVSSPTASDVMGDTIALTEVMGRPCGTSDTADAVWNEYLELYNYGDHAVNVAGWWITDGEDEKGNPDMLVSWDVRSPTFIFGDKLIFNTTVIPPKSFAIVLPSNYYPGKGEYKMPYIFPVNTIILTIAEGEAIGDDIYGIDVVVAKNPIVLYQGTSTSISNIISTYGTPTFSGSPLNIVDDNKDAIPLALPHCHSAERIDPTGPDIEGNWRKVKDGSPGK
jgi:hypothetical protein